MKIAIIGTAGRDKSKPMTLPLWQWMVKDALDRVPEGSHLVSGGAAWADHLAVALFLSGHAARLTLHLPAPFERRFTSIGKTAGSATAANHYHAAFSRVVGRDTLQEISDAISRPNADVTYEAAAPGYGGMFARNVKIARSGADRLLAYTFGVCGAPVDGGTRDTWVKSRMPRTHIELPML